MLVTIAAITASACATTRMTVTPLELAKQARPLLQEGSAEVTGPRGTVRVSADEMANIRVREGDLERPMRVSVRDLIGGCVDGVTSPGCLAEQAVDEPAIERQQLRFDRRRAQIASSFGLMTGAFVPCLAACDNSASLEKGVATGGVVVLATAGVLLLVGTLIH